MFGVGFEPTPPKRLQLKCSALDHSAIQTLQVTIKTSLLFDCLYAVSNFKTLRIGIEPMTLRLTVVRSNQLS